MPLVLARKVGQKIKIGEGDSAVVLTVIEIDRNVVRIQLDASFNVPIMRMELGDRKEKVS